MIADTDKVGQQQESYSVAYQERIPVVAGEPTLAEMEEKPGKTYVADQMAHDLSYKGPLFT
ncbi:hypothetical protein KDA_64270 [Dictyobacter alpinus]|uniref:Uncharacterized protein n=1 Tax=Dictyobacter alpinus TaxID=2014873 RepID=A0A402BHU2_9CHLR|nr:hypothetical protein KDA_64270 [Dictyobacter alpinus]